MDNISLSSVPELQSREVLLNPVYSPSLSERIYASVTFPTQNSKSVQTEPMPGENQEETEQREEEGEQLREPEGRSLSTDSADINPKLWDYLKTLGLQLMIHPMQSSVERTTQPVIADKHANLSPYQKAIAMAK